MLNVRGDLLPALNQTGEVFRTDCLTGSATYWRMFRGGTERGRLFNTATGSNSGDFQVQSTVNNGQLWLRNSGTDGIRLNSQIWTANPNGTVVSTNGFVGIGAQNTGVIATQGPWSRLHLDNGGTAVASTFRPWMRNGIYMSGYDDMMYVGQLGARAGFDNCDAVIAWGDNAFPLAGPDHFRLLFMGNATDPEGLETVRLTGDGMFGIGDFNTAGVEPDERLDILTSTARIRQLPTATYLAPVNDRDKVVVVRTDGRLNWRDASTLGNACSSGWSLTGTTAATAYNGNPCPPQSIDLVGIGTNAPIAKLHIVKSLAAGGVIDRGMYLLQSVAVSGGEAVGADVVITGASATNYGARGTASGAVRNYGLFGNATSLAGTNWGLRANGQNAGTNYGVDAYASGGSSATGVRAVAAGGSVSNIGLYASATGTGALAGQFDGDVVITGTSLTVNGVFYPSDANLKTNVQTLSTSSSAQITQLDAMTYEFIPSAAPQADLPVGTQAGFMAQQVQQFFPDLVRDMEFSAVSDSVGNVIQPAVQFKAINYVGMMPYVVSAMKEQNARIDQLEALLAQCCAGGPVDNRSMDALGSNGGPLETDLRIVPNPVAASTQLRYTVGTPGRVRLEVTDNTGRVIEVLEEATRSTGSYTYEWNTQQLAAGTYYCTLYVNGEQLVKKAVKLNER